MARRKPKYNSLRIKHIDSNGLETIVWCDEVTFSKSVAILINMPVQNTGNRYITDSDIVFNTDDKLVVNGEIRRITEIPQITPKKQDNNSRRGLQRKEKVLVTT